MAKGSMLHRALAICENVSPAVVRVGGPASAGLVDLGSERAAVDVDKDEVRVDIQSNTIATGKQVSPGGETAEGVVDEDEGSISLACVNDSMHQIVDLEVFKTWRGGLG